ncbi:hypothetical protein ACFWZY_01665 [Streptomyces sp. NPDC058992]|uniref:hypothetical protein n=1 Tax=Streptomyces sp. NPDC058992 TaxID=3346688 RepID=UPI0036B79B55
MTARDYARTAGLALASLAQCALSGLYGQNGVWPLCIALAATGCITAEAAHHAHVTGAERRQLAIELERLARPEDTSARAISDHIAVGWHDLEHACCLTYWASRGREHEDDCPADVCTCTLARPCARCRRTEPSDTE